MLLSATPAANLCTCYLRGEIGCLHSTTDPIATMGICLIPLSSRFFQTNSLQHGPFLFRKFLRHHDLYTSKITSKFSISQSFFFHASDLHWADPSLTSLPLQLIVLASDFSTLTFFLSISSLKNQFQFFRNFSVNQKLNNFSNLLFHGDNILHHS